jgi:hypothetical protein
MGMTMRAGEILRSAQNDTRALFVILNPSTALRIDSVKASAVSSAERIFPNQLAKADPGCLIPIQPV